MRRDRERQKPCPNPPFQATVPGLAGKMILLGHNPSPFCLERSPIGPRGVADNGTRGINEFQACRPSAPAPVLVFGNPGAKAANPVKILATDEQIGRNAEVLAFDIGAIVEGEDQLESLGGCRQATGIDQDAHRATDDIPLRQGLHASRQPAGIRDTIRVDKGQNGSLCHSHPAISGRACPRLGNGRQSRPPLHQLLGSDSLDLIAGKLESLAADVAMGRELAVTSDVVAQ